MFAGPKFLHKMFAPVSLGFVLALAAVTPAKTKPEAEATANLKRQSASTQFAKAEEQREALNGKASEKRTLADYKQVVASYHRVSLITPRAPEVPDSLLAMAELYVEMGDHFGRSYYQSAVDAYQFLVREYPTNKHCQDAMLHIGKLQRDQLGEAALAEKEDVAVEGGIDAPIPIPPPGRQQIGRIAAMAGELAAMDSEAVAGEALGDEFQFDRRAAETMDQQEAGAPAAHRETVIDDRHLVTRVRS